MIDLHVVRLASSPLSRKGDPFGRSPGFSVEHDGLQRTEAAPPPEHARDRDRCSGSSAREAVLRCGDRLETKNTTDNISESILLA